MRRSGREPNCAPVRATHRKVRARSTGFGLCTCATPTAVRGGASCRQGSLEPRRAPLGCCLVVAGFLNLVCGRRAGGSAGSTVAAHRALVLMFAWCALAADELPADCLLRRPSLSIELGAPYGYLSSVKSPLGVPTPPRPPHRSRHDGNAEINRLSRGSKSLPSIWLSGSGCTSDR